MEQKIIPSITINQWPELAMPETEINNILMYLAYKANKPVTFNCYSDDEGYSESSVSIRVAIADGCHKVTKTEPIKIGDSKYKPSKDQVTVDIELNVSIEKQILDSEGIVLAYIDHNRIVIPIELTATDNQLSRNMLAYIVEHCIELLDFQMTDKLLEQRKRFAERLYDSFVRAIQTRINEHQDRLRILERDADRAYYTIIEYQVQRPVINKELAYLNRLQQLRRPRLFKNQAQGLIELLSCGQYSSIEANDNGSITAVTSPVTIKYDGLSFPVGRYQINIGSKGNLKIEALDEHPNASYPHPHIAQDDYPCLGNISGDIPKMIGSMKIAEALTVLYEFLGQYNPDNPYEKIGHFDPTGSYEDEDNPCEDCDESCSPGCINSCSHNNGQYSCSDCYDYRSEYCYIECDYNQDFELISPCDNCQQAKTEHCYLKCRYNENWQLHKPCEENCEFEQCGSQCQFYSKLQTIPKEVTTDADTE